MMAGNSYKLTFLENYWVDCSEADVVPVNIRQLMSPFLSANKEWTY